LSDAEVSVNRRALELVQRLVEKPDKFNVVIKQTRSGTTLVDVGIKAKGGFEAGKKIVEICLGGYGKAEIYPATYDDLKLSSVFVYTDRPAVSTLGSQFADWRIKRDDFSAIGSGPARALVRRNKELYEKIDYKDESEDAVLVLETSSEPPEPVVEDIVRECRVQPKRLFLILVPTASVAGSAQVSGRIVETGLHKLAKLGLDPKRASHAYGSAPVAPVHPKFVAAMGRSNDAILYGGFAHYDVEGYDDEELQRIVVKASSSASEGYGRPFKEIFKAVGYDFYKIDPNLFAPAVVSVCNLDTGNSFVSGSINVGVLRDSFGL
jgi:methenyltetrahydromethanopterin cyclohydrolase